MKLYFSRILFDPWVRAQESGPCPWWLQATPFYPFFLLVIVILSGVILVGGCGWPRKNSFSRVPGMQPITNMLQYRVFVCFLFFHGFACASLLFFQAILFSIQKTFWLDITCHFKVNFVNEITNFSRTLFDPLSPGPGIWALSWGWSFGKLRAFQRAPKRVKANKIQRVHSGCPGQG